MVEMQATEVERHLKVLVKFITIYVCPAIFTSSRGFLKFIAGVSDTSFPQCLGGLEVDVQNGENTIKS